MYFTPNKDCWCNKCPLHRSRDKEGKAVHTYARTPFSNLLLFILASYPGAKEEKEGLGLVGESGKALDREILKVLALRRARLPKCYTPLLDYVAKGNVIRCNPRDGRVEKVHRRACKTWLDKDLLAMHPKLPILACGMEAKKALLGEEGSLYKMRGTIQYYESHPVVVTTNPVTLVRYRQETIDANGRRSEGKTITGSPKYFFIKDLELMMDLVEDYVQRVVLDGDKDEEFIGRGDEA